jgi:hypothetical protein
MSTFVLKSAEKFPVGTSVGVYPQNARNRSEPKLGPPVGAAIASVAVAADGSLTYVGLQPGVCYAAYAATFGYVEFNVPDRDDFTEGDSSEFETVPAAEAVTNIAAPASGTIFLVGGLTLPRLRKITRIGFLAGNVAGATLTNQWFAIVRRSDRRILARTASDGATAWAAGAIKELALQEPYTPPDDIPVYLARLVAGTTSPNFAGQTLLGSSAQQGGTADTGLTVPLALGVQLGAITPVASLPYAYVRGGSGKRVA